MGLFYSADPLGGGEGVIQPEKWRRKAEISLFRSSCHEAENEEGSFAKYRFTDSVAAQLMLTSIGYLVRNIHFCLG